MGYKDGFCGQEIGLSESTKYKIMILFNFKFIVDMFRCLFTGIH